MHKATYYMAQLLIFLLGGLRPLLGPARCRFSVTCGNYALMQFSQQPLHKAVWLIARRLVACGPFG